jgi:tRNA uridine 5-carboxymethylaminomethyl modification enzyme
VDRGSAREGMTIPGDYDFRGLRGLREEAVQTLEEIRPETLGRASRLAGVTPADVALIEIALTRDERARAKS